MDDLSNDGKTIERPGVVAGHGCWEYDDGSREAFVSLDILEPLHAYPVDGTDDAVATMGHAEEHDRLATIVWPVEFAAFVVSQLSAQIARSLACPGLRGDSCDDGDPS